MSRLSLSDRLRSNLTSIKMLFKQTVGFDQRLHEQENAEQYYRVIAVFLFFFVCVNKMHKKTLLHFKSVRRAKGVLCLPTDGSWDRLKPPR